MRGYPRKVVPRTDPPESEQNLDAAGGDWSRPMRTLGLELLNASAGYEGLFVTGGVEIAVIAGLVARQRRLAQAIYRHPRHRRS
jgi:hypothetical protein